MPTKDELAEEWNQLAPGWIARIRGPGDPSREFLLDDWMLRVVGEGRFSRMLADRGAQVTGVDLCPAMIEAAESKRVGDERYVVGDMESLRGVANESFDLAISYISLVDVHNLSAALSEAHRILKPGGQFIVCNLAPMVTAGNRWLRDESGEKICFYLDNYLDESARTFRMCDREINNMHRTLATYLNGFIAAGFTLEGIEEPYPSPRQLEQDASNADIFRVPLFIIYLLRKPRALVTVC
jgi:SAM-dependent methyltransferase